MMSKEVEPADIGKHSKYIKIAQEDISEMDVLICGRCHTAFHFVEDFQDHKIENKCEKEQMVRKCTDTKPQVWAFLLWKATQVSNHKELSGSQHSWKLYQQWIKLDPSLRETWTVAGTTIQSFNKLGSGSLQEMPVKITKTVVDSPPVKQAHAQQNRMVEQKAIGPPVKKPIGSGGGGGGGLLQQNKITTSSQSSDQALNRRAKRTNPMNQEIKEEVVEKIVAKRFNPRKKCYEYLVKWESFSQDAGNTWEVQHNLDKVPQILELFETQLARQKEQRALQQAAKEQQMKEASSKNEVRITPGTGPGVRTAVSTTKPTEEAHDLVALAAGLAGVKRKLTDSDYDDSSMMNDDDLEDDLIQHTLKKMKNGNSVAVKVETRNNEVKNTVHRIIQNGAKTEGAEVIVIKEGTGTGIVKKTGSTNAALQRNEAQIRVLTRNESMGTKSGIVRLDGTTTIVKHTVVQQKLSPALAKNQSTVQINQVNRSSPIPQQRQQAISTVKRTVQQAKQQQQRSNNAALSPNSGKMIIRSQAGQKQQQPAKQVTPEQKILQLSKSGDLRVTKKSIHSPQQQQELKRGPPASNVQIQKIQQIAPPSPTIDSDGSNGGLALCPQTGKVLDGSGEEMEQELTQQELEQQMLQAAAQAAEEEAETHQTLDLSSLDQPMVNEDGSPILVSGEDGTIYQVAGKNAEGQTILIAQGADGEQQFAYVASDEIESQVAAAVGASNAAGLTLDSAVADAVAQMTQEQAAELAASGEHYTGEVFHTTDGEQSAGIDQPLMIETGNSDSQEGNIPAEVVRAEPPSPGGTRKVVLLLQDGTFVVTEMNDDDYQALNIAN